MKKFLEIIKNKWLLKGTTTLLLVAIVIACYIGLNLLVKKINIEDIDCTEKKLYSLSDETKKKISNLNEEITIQLINLNQYEYIKEYASKYTKVSDKVNVDEIDDLSARVDLMTKYSLENTDSLIVVKTAEKEKTITLNDLYTYDYTTGEQIDVTEEAITNAIIEITLDEKPQIYILSGNTYYQTEQVLANIITDLQAESNDVNYLDILSKGAIPEECDLLVITTLKKDITELEKDQIIQYIQKGGRLMLLTSQNVVDVETPNFEQVLAQYGISIGFGAIFEQDETKMLQNSPEFIISDINTSSSVMKDIDMKLQMCLIDAGKIQFADSSKLEELGVTYETIATTGEKAFIRTNFDIPSYTKTDKDGAEESMIVGALVSKKISDDIESKLIIYSNEMCASNLQIPISNQYYTLAVELYNNKDIILNSISYLTERTDTITIRKTGENQIYTVTEQENTIIKYIIFITPAIIIMIGIAIWQIRRRKK